MYTITVLTIRAETFKRLSHDSNRIHKKLQVKFFHLKSMLEERVELQYTI